MDSCMVAEDPNLPLSQLGHFRHLPPGPDRTKVIGRSYLKRALARAQRDVDLQQLVHPSTFNRPQQLGLDKEDARFRFRVPDGARQGRPARPQQTWTTEAEEGRDLAQSPVPLPSDRHTRPPSLERQEAFRDETTCKRHYPFGLADSLVSVVSDDVDPEVAQLYQLGLLYDDDYSRGALFNLNTIVHDEPEYTLRLAKKPRKLNKSRGFDLDLPLKLSFARLHKDEDIARYLITPSPSETSEDLSPLAQPHLQGPFGSVRSLNVSGDYDSMNNGSGISVSQFAADQTDPQTTQFPDFDEEYCSDTSSTSYDDADLVILPLEDDYDSQEGPSQKTRDRPCNDAAASWIMLGDDS